MEKVLIVDLGGQHDQLLARRVRECHVYCEVMLLRLATAEAVEQFAPMGILLTGGSMDISEENELPRELLELGIPVLAVGVGCLRMAQALGGEVCPGDGKSASRSLTVLEQDDPLFRELLGECITWMPAGAQVAQLPEGFRITAHTAACPVAAMSCPERRLFGLRFLPESPHTEGGTKILRHFLRDICGTSGDWVMETCVSTGVAQIRARVGQRPVLLALSGGVDSSVVATLLNRAVGQQLTCIFVDHGMLRRDEADQVEAFFSRMNMRFIRVNARERFLAKLAGVTEPEEKRSIIALEFVRVFEEEAAKLGEVDFLAQGTIYPDVMESGLGYADVIRSHRLGSLPEHIQFRELLEPLRMLFKDEVRELGKAMGLPDYLICRQPFPGPGLAIRIIGEVTEEKIALLQQADGIFRDCLEQAHMDKLLGQYFAVLTDTRTVNTAAPIRRREYALALRAVTTEDFMTAKWARLPYELLDRVSAQILRQVPGINRVVYDITSKPPASIEWE